MTDTSRPLERSGRRGRRRLSPVQKYEAFVQVLTGEMTVVQCADHWGVDCSTIMRAREVAKKGALDALASSRPGVRSGGVDPELVMARDEAARLGEALFERWGDIDGGYRKLAHRGSYENLVWVSPSTLYRVLAAQGLVLPARPQRTPVPARPLPDWIEWKRHQIWIYDITHFPRAGRVAYAILDVVTRKWLATHLTAEETATQVQVVFTQALDTEGLWPAVEARQADRARHGDDSDEEPILLAMSDNGPQMRAGTTREFLALCSIAARFGRPGTPTDQAWIETLFGHIKTEWPHLEKITDPNTLRTDLDIARHDYNTRRLHASLRYVTPDDEHHERAERIRQARQDGPKRQLTKTIYRTLLTDASRTRQNAPT